MIKLYVSNQFGPLNIEGRYRKPLCEREREVAPHANQGGHRTALTCKKKCIYTFAKKTLYVKQTYCDHPNKNIEHPDLRITKIWVQQK